MSVVSNERESESMNVVHTLYRAGLFQEKSYDLFRLRMTFSRFEFYFVL